RLEAGNSLPDACSSASGTPRSCSKKRCCDGSGHDSSMLRIVFGDDAVMYCRGERREGRTLQRPPPLMMILRPPSLVFSSSMTGRTPVAAKMAAMRPAAPAARTAMGVSGGVMERLVPRRQPADRAHAPLPAPSDLDRSRASAQCDEKRQPRH